jgi:cytochrome P450
MASDGMMAGIDTTGNTAGFLLYNLARYPEAQEALRQEIEKVVGMDPEATRITEKHVNQMPYLRGCLQESMRMTPTVVGLSRKTQVRFLDIALL